MRHFIGLVIAFAWVGGASALTPLPDNSPGFFAGEWAGAGSQGSYCYLNLSTDGSGWVLIDGGSGDWFAARMQWRNQRQSIQVETIMPANASPRLRVMPLEKFGLISGINQSLRLTWNDPAGGCHLQKLEITAQHLQGARKTAESLLQGVSK